MPWIPEEEIKRAREITAIEYLKKYQPNRLKKSSARNEWELIDHDSFKINELTSQWHWKSRDIGGNQCLKFPDPCRWVFLSGGSANAER